MIVYIACLGILSKRAQYSMPFGQMVWFATSQGWVITLITIIKIIIRSSIPRKPYLISLVTRNRL